MYYLQTREYSHSTWDEPSPIATHVDTARAVANDLSNVYYEVRIVTENGELVSRYGA